jgi:hypothetical protein
MKGCCCFDSRKVAFLCKEAQDESQDLVDEDNLMIEISFDIIMMICMVQSIHDKFFEESQCKIEKKHKKGSNQPFWVCVEAG